MIKISSIPILQFDDFVKKSEQNFANDGRIACMFATNINSTLIVYCVTVFDHARIIKINACYAPKEWPSLTNQYPQMHLFEREMHELYGINVQGHPQLNPVRYCKHDRLRKEEYFSKVYGTGIHEVAVGPVHAGVIEPGHFRFQCYGEKVFNLDISLGYQHRGIENMFVGGPDLKTIHLAETVSGDSTIAHVWAYSMAVEKLASCEISERAQVLRGILLELERMANHTGDLGALSGDVSYLPTASYCGRLRGDFLNMTALICGNRFGRNAIRPGGVNFDIDLNTIAMLKERLATTYKDVKNAVSLLWKTKSVTDRFDDTGKISTQQAKDLGLVGPAARASGIMTDTRRNFAYGPYKDFNINTSGRGDVYARVHARIDEIDKSAELIKNWLEMLPTSSCRVDCNALEKNSIAVSLTEGWRGQICHCALTDENGAFKAYKIIDPSFHNWQGLAAAMRNAQISDFPLCNKSFNLSYCGHDL